MVGQFSQGGKRAGCCQSGTWGETDLSSPSAAPYKREAQRRFGSERYSEPVVRMPQAPAGGWTAPKVGKPQPTRLDGRQGERLSESSASRLAAHAKPASQRTDHLLAWAHRAAGALRQAVKDSVWCLSANSVMGGRPSFAGAAGASSTGCCRPAGGISWPVA